MLSKVYSATCIGIDAHLVEIEVDVSNGLPQMTIVGLPDQAVRESKERVYSALRNSGFPISPKKITVNLAPADIKKEGSSNTKLSLPPVPTKTLFYRACLTKGRSILSKNVRK